MTGADQTLKSKIQAAKVRITESIFKRSWSKRVRYWFIVLKQSNSDKYLRPRPNGNRRKHCGHTFDVTD